MAKFKFQQKCSPCTVCSDGMGVMISKPHRNRSGLYVNIVPLNSKRNQTQKLVRNLDAADYIFMMVTLSKLPLFKP